MIRVPAFNNNKTHFPTLRRADEQSSTRRLLLSRRNCDDSMSDGLRERNAS